MRFRLVLLIAIGFLCVGSASAQRTLAGEVTDVFDGGSFSLFDGRTNFKVRLEYIDAPYAEQPLYEVVKARLASLIKGRWVIVEFKSSSEGFYIGRVLLGNVDVAMQLLRDGAVWYSVPESSSHPSEVRSEYSQVESLAKSEKRGVWGIVGIVPAWELRIEKAKAEQARLDAEQKEATEKMIRSGIPARPALGMSLTELTLVCGTHPNDLIRLTETERGRSGSVLLQSTPERASKLCFGYFTFEKGKVDYISRTNY